MFDAQKSGRYTVVTFLQHMSEIKSYYMGQRGYTYNIYNFFKSADRRVMDMAPTTNE